MSRREKNKYFFLYKTTNRINNKFYIGVHSTNNLNDGYLGSGKILKYSISKYGKENFEIEKLEFFEKKEDLYNKEKKIVNEELLKNPLCMNLGVGGKGGILNEDHKNKFHLSNHIGGQKTVHSLIKRHQEKLKNDPIYRQRWCNSQSMSQKGKQMKETNSQFGTRWVTNGIENKKTKDLNLQDGWHFGRK